MSTLLEELYFSNGGYSVVPSPGGKDKPDDMATAWLNGDLDRYEELRAAHRGSRCAKDEGESMGRPRIFCRNKIRSLRAAGNSMIEIAAAVGCGVGTVHRVLNNE